MLGLATLIFRVLKRHKTATTTILFYAVQHAFFGTEWFTSAERLGKILFHAKSIMAVSLYLIFLAIVGEVHEVECAIGREVHELTHLVDLLDLVGKHNRG